MQKIVKGIIWLVLIMVSIESVAKDMNNTYALAEQVVIPGYTPPQPTSTPSQPGLIQPGISANDPHAVPQPPATPEMMHKSCEKLVGVTLPLDVTLAGFKNIYEETDKYTTYMWPRDGEPNLEITFTEENKPVYIKGNITTIIPNGKDMSFLLSDVQRILNTPGQIMGYSYAFSRKGTVGTLTVYTDTNNIVTSFTTTLMCDKS